MGDVKRKLNLPIYITPINKAITKLLDDKNFILKISCSKHLVRKSYIVVNCLKMEVTYIHLL